MNSASATRQPREYRIYVIELDGAVWEKSAIRSRNPERRMDKPCLYVGYTVHTPEQRFQQHKSGDHDAPIVRHFGLELKPRLYDNAPITNSRLDAERAEAHWADRLRRKGFGVWEGRLGPVQPTRKTDVAP